MPIGPILVLATLGILALATSAKAGGKTTPDGKAPVRPEFQDIPLPLLQEMAKAIQLLTITDFVNSPDGSVRSVVITGPVTKEAVQNATALAAKLEAAGFSQAARTLRDLAVLAGKRIPSPEPDKAVPLPIECFSPAEQTQINRLIALERDPKILQGVLDALKARVVPAACRIAVDNVINMLSAMVIQIQARLAEEEALRKIEEELRKKDAIPPVPGPTPFFPPSPSPSPAPGPTSTKVTIVKDGDGFARLSARLLGDVNQGNRRWRELRDRNIPVDADGRRRQKYTDARGGVKPILHEGEKLFVPESWSVVGPSIPIPAPTPLPVPGVRFTVVQPNDGFSRIAQRLGMSSAFRDLIARNIPVSADGKARKKLDLAKGGISPVLQPGDRLFVPESWPPSSFATVSGVGEYDHHGFDVAIGDAGEGPGFSQKTQEEMSSEALVSHLNRLHRKHPLAVDKVQRKADKRIIARFQKVVGLPITATVTPAVVLKAAEFGQVELPLVLDWPVGSTKEHVESYRAILLDIAQAAKSKGDERAAHELVESAKRENGQALGVTS